MAQLREMLRFGVVGAIGFADDFLKVSKFDVKGVPGRVRLGLGFLIALLASGALDVAPLVGGVWPLGEWREAFESIEWTASDLRSYPDARDQTLAQYVSNLLVAFPLHKPQQQD